MLIGKDRQVELLLIEDNSGDILLTKEAFEELDFSENLSVVTDGEAALDFLYKQGRYQNAPTPDLIILDLNIPRVDGRELLAKIKTDNNLKRIPVLVLSTSKSERDIKYCYELQANCYLIKPVDFEEFLEIVRFIRDFWLGIVKIPTMV
jgi:two-component system, chemotaxis family, response regulator Rcp1